MKTVKEELEVLQIHYTQDELEQRFFKDFGCINFLSPAEQRELDLATEFHARHKALHPEMHEENACTPSRCYHVTACKCGLKTAVDSAN